MSRLWLKGRFGAKTVRLAPPGLAPVSATALRSTEVDIPRMIERVSEGPSAPAWASAVEALEQKLQTANWRRKGQRIRIVIANAFVRYLVIPWQAEGLTETEREQLARALLLERYGEHESPWQVAMEPQRFGRPALAAAMEADLVAALHGITEQQGCRVAAIVPALVDELNRHRRQLGKAGCGWLVDASDERLASVAFVRGSWSQVANERYKRFTSAFEARLAPQLRRDVLRMPDLLQGTVFLVNGAGIERPGRIDQVWPLIELQGRP